jgi:hypothetical protein
MLVDRPAPPPDRPPPATHNTPCAPQVRAGLASLGFTSLDELVGRADLLRQRDVRLAKTRGLDLSVLTTFAGASKMTSSERIAQVSATAPGPPGQGGGKQHDRGYGDRAGGAH